MLHGWRSCWENWLATSMRCSTSCRCLVKLSTPPATQQLRLLFLLPPIASHAVSMQGFVQLDEMDENQLALHIDMLEDMVSARLQQAPAGAPAAKGHGTAQQSSGPRAAAHDPSCERCGLRSCAAH